MSVRTALAVNFANRRLAVAPKYNKQNFVYFTIY